MGLYKIVLVFFFGISFYGWSQESRVLITEKKRGKRIVLMAENTTTDTLNVFLMVLSEGYRRSASKPVLKNLPPKSKMPMATLIELTDVPSSYTYNLIVNEKQFDIHHAFDKPTKDIEKVIKDKLVLFSKPGCDRCELLSETLTQNGIAHREFNVEDDLLLYQQFMVFIKKDAPDKKQIRFPVIWNKSYTIYGYDSVVVLLNELKD